MSEDRSTRRHAPVATPRPFAGSGAERFRFYTLLLLLALCFLGGGGSRADIQSLLYLRPAVVLCIVALLLSPGPWAFRALRPLFILFGLFAATMLIQLIPLPPDLWLSMPGHDRYAEAAAAAGIAQPWRPISLTPDLTWNSVLALLPALAVLIGFAGIRPDQQEALAPILIAAVCVSAVFAVAQMAGGQSSPLFLYQVTHTQSGVGFFANRNHQAALLAMTFPMLRLWLAMPAQSAGYERTRVWLAVATGCLLVPTMLVTGSRAGLVLGLLGIAGILALAPVRRDALRLPGRLRLIALTAMAVVPIALAFVTIFFGRALAIDRLAQSDANVRVENMPTVLEMIWNFFPWGTGFGSFDPAFRGFEPDAVLDPLYFNHAHNDLIELALTGGLPAILVFAGFLAWWFRATIRAFLPFGRPSRQRLFQRVGGMMIAILFAASIVDYPLRTPLLTAIFALACCWLQTTRAHRNDDLLQREMTG